MNPLGRLPALLALYPDRTVGQARLRWLLSTPYVDVIHTFNDDRASGLIGWTTEGDARRIIELRGEPYARHELLDAALQTAPGKSWLALAQHGCMATFQEHGFVSFGECAQFRRGVFLEASRDEVVPFEPQHLLSVLHLDRKATGEDRRAYLQEHLYLGLVYLEAGRVRGFALPLAGEGCIVAERPDIGLELQRWLLPLQDQLIVPLDQAAIVDHFAAQGFTRTTVATHLVRGHLPDMHPSFWYAIPYAPITTT